MVKLNVVLKNDILPRSGAISLLSCRSCLFVGSLIIEKGSQRVLYIDDIVVDSNL